jgi:hypothetical protein
MMHFNFDKKTPVNYLTEKETLTGTPFNTIIAISNRNLNGDVVNHSDALSQMMSMAMVVSAGELSSGMLSVANNLERDMISGAYDISNKRAIMGTLGMSEITFRATELSELYSEKAAREIAAALLSPGSNADTEANTWIDTEKIRENNGRDDVIDFLLKKNPNVMLSAIYDNANPDADIKNYRIQKGVAVDSNELTAKVDELKQRIKASFQAKIRDIVNSRGPVYAQEFIGQTRVQIDICLKEMRDELQGFQSSITAKDSAIKTAVEEYKTANGKFFGRQKAVEAAEEVLCNCVINAVINDREINRRNGAITFYTWFTQEMATAEQKLDNIVATIRNACEEIRSRIAIINSNLSDQRGVFEIDLTKPYISQVDVQPSAININQFMLSLDNESEIYTFDSLSPKTVADLMRHYTATLNSGAEWASMSVEDALKNLPNGEAENIIRKAIALSSPMCPLNYRGYINKMLNNYYYIGVQEQSATGLKDEIINFDNCIPAGEIHETYFSSIGSRDRIVIYHQYGVFPTYAISGAESYRHAHDSYMSHPTAFSCFIDEDLRITMAREGFSVVPKEKSDDSLELWVKGLIFGLITRDKEGKFQYKDESNTDMALFGYQTSLNTTYRDEAFRNFKRECANLQPQYEQHMINRAKAEGQDAINSIIADAKINYLEKYSLNDLSPADFKNPLYKGIVTQLTEEINFVNKKL